MKMRISFAAMLFLGLLGCSDDFEYKDFVIDYAPQDKESCSESFGKEYESGSWSSWRTSQSFLKREICSRLGNILSDSPISDGVECVSVTDNGDSYLVAAQGNGEIYHFEVNINGCYYFLRGVSNYVYSYQSENLKFDPCVCDDIEGYARYYNASSSLVVGDPELLSSSSNFDDLGLSSESNDLQSSSSQAAIMDHERIEASSKNLQCPAIGHIYNHEGYTVAYEFDDPSDLGRDYIGNNHAKIESEMEVDGDCNNLVLDGTNGLYVPKAKVFNNKNFVIEVRFWAEEKADLGNIFVAEPPGRGEDGWQIRLDGDEVRFHIRDAVIGDWVVFSMGKITLKEWHTARVELTSDLPQNLKMTLDGNLTKEEFDGDVSDLRYDLGIAYDRQHQMAYSRKFFKGKIDYIRYGSR